MPIIASDFNTPLTAVTVHSSHFNDSQYNTSTYRSSKLIFTHVQLKVASGCRRAGDGLVFKLVRSGLIGS